MRLTAKGREVVMAAASRHLDTPISLVRVGSQWAVVGRERAPWVSCDHYASQLKTWAGMIVAEVELTRGDCRVWWRDLITAQSRRRDVMAHLRAEAGPGG